jgi:hypothetical protein
MGTLVLLPSALSTSCASTGAMPAFFTGGAGATKHHAL